MFNPQPNPNEDLKFRRAEGPQPSAEPSPDPLKGASVDPALRNLEAKPANKDIAPSTPVTRLADGVAVLSLGGPGEKTVSFTLERSKALREAIEDLQKNPPKGLVITGPVPGMFAVGADINTIRTVTDPAVGAKLAREGQALFDELAKIPCKKVAAISGPCVGGGCEMALACDVRIISNDPRSQIGLPETQLGILPGWGGTQRLPRLVGLRKALDIILNGKKLRPDEALKSGLVNEVVEPDKLLERAQALASGAASERAHKLGFVDRLSSMEGMLGSLVRSAFRVRSKTIDMVEKKSGGFYPALPAALDSVLKGLDKGMKAGLEFEAKKLGELIATPESKSLVHIYFLTEASKSLGKPGRQAVEQVQSVIVGAGVMGAGIGCVLAKSEAGVVLKDINDAALEKGKGHIESSLAKSKRLSEEDRKQIMDRIELTKGDSPTLARCNFAIEAVAEKMNIKKIVMADLGNKLPEDAIIATNTSSLSVTEIAKVVKNPSRVLGMHWFNPPELMPLVEIVRGAQTSEEAIQAVAALSTKCGKMPIVVADVPGFLVNRILTPYMNEVAFLIKDGYDFRDIDKAAKKFGMPMGPARLLDEVSFEIAAHVSDTMRQGYGERMDCPPYVKQLLEKGYVGRKSGKGFYDYSDPSKKDPAPNREVIDIIAAESPRKADPDLRQIERRLVLSMINEAVKCLDEGVAGKPGRLAASQIDLGTVMGTGFPPFRGGLMHYAESLGAQALVDELKKLETELGPRFKPAEGLVRRAAEKKSFYE